MIDDTRTDPVFSATSAAAAFPTIGSYIGVPILLADGTFFGTLCAVDPAPRALNSQQADLLVVLARLLATQIERDRELAQRREAAEALQRARDELDARVRERTAELSASNKWLAFELAERRRTEAALRASEERFRALVQHTSDVIATVDAAGVTRYVSPSIEAVLGYRPAELVGARKFDLIHPDDLASAQLLFAELLRTTHLPITAEVRVRHADGSWRHIEVIANNLLDEPSVGGIVANYRDITERKGFEEQLRHQAFHDPLTGLPNRALLLDRLDHALARTGRRGSQVAVLFLDLDRFKVVNDSLGHQTGDRLLVAVAERLRACLRPEDTPARLGGDEFVVLLEDVRDVRDATRVAERIAECLQGGIALAGHEIHLTASIGIAIAQPRPDAAPADLQAWRPTRADDLLRDADLAMYRAKARGKARYEVFDASMNARALERLRLEADLRRALELGQLQVHYQPQVDLATGRMAGVEALARWQHPRRGMVLPTEFIPLAEETGLILPIGWWMLEEACRQGQAWQEQHPGAAPVTMSVNLSGRQFQDPDLPRRIDQILRATRFTPANLLLEITESVVMANGAATLATLRALRALGVRLAIDDFGTGYSSLAYLIRFPIDRIKIDRSFVAGLGRARQYTAVVQTIVLLARNLGAAVVAEGVETGKQSTILQALGCELGQGFHFAEPLAPQGIDELLGHSPSQGVAPQSHRR